MDCRGMHGDAWPVDSEQGLALTGEQDPDLRLRSALEEVAPNLLIRSLVRSIPVIRCRPYLQVRVQQASVLGVLVRDPPKRFVERRPGTPRQRSARSGSRSRSATRGRAGISATGSWVPGSSRQRPAARLGQGWVAVARRPGHDDAPGPSGVHAHTRAD
jgi:hypothetical protein